MADEVTHGFNVWSGFGFLGFKGLAHWLKHDLFTTRKQWEEAVSKSRMIEENIRAKMDEMKRKDMDNKQLAYLGRIIQ